VGWLLANPLLSGIDFTQVLIAFTVLVASLTFHEAAHAWTADRLGDPTARQLGRLSLNPTVHVDVIGTIVFPLVAMVSGLPLIGWAKPVPVDLRRLKAPRRDFALVAAAGPASNLVLAVAGAMLYQLIPPVEPGDIAARATMTPLIAFVRMFIRLNVLLAVFNMVPVPPLDGGNVLIGVLPHAGARLVEQLRPYGILILYALMLTGVLFRLIDPLYFAIMRWLV
jgi:Zn-dependent protease